MKHHKKTTVIWLLLIFLMLISLIVSLFAGAIPINGMTLIKSLSGHSVSEQMNTVIWQIRIPRILLGVFVGALLAICGAAMQGLFRNALADPGLIGISSGAALGAAVAIVFSKNLNLVSETFAISVSAFVFGLMTTYLVYKLSTKSGRTEISTMILAGIAVGFLASALIGLITYFADDNQLRTLVFWNMGTLSGVQTPHLIVTGSTLLFLITTLPFMSKALNALSLGESEAFYMGFNVERLKNILIILTALGVSVSVYASGLIGFIGLVMPHLARLLVGPDHKMLMPVSAILGAALLILSDSLARTLIAPAELPIGIITALMGAPFFLFILKRRSAQ